MAAVKEDAKKEGKVAVEKVDGDLVVGEKKVSEVRITDDQPAIPVTVESVKAPIVMPPTVTKGEGTTLPPNTTEQDDKISAGQRLVNMTWEVTQSYIAVVVVSVTMVKAYTLLQGQDIPTIMAVAFGTIVGFYFARTNHQSIGGVGKKPVEPPYTGR